MIIKLRTVSLRVYDEFTGRFTGVIVQVRVAANSRKEAKEKAINNYDWVLRGAKSFTYYNPTKEDR
jgi:hypothetical protein